MSIPGAASVPAVDPKSEGIAHQAAAAVQGMLERGIMPRDIMTREAFENAIMVVLAMGGSTNAVLHLLAIAHEANVDLKIDDFDRLSRITPYLTDLRPAGRYVMSDLDKVGGVPVVMRELLNAGLLHPNVMTVTGKTVAENLDDLDIPAADGDVVHPISAPRTPTGGLVILRGNLSPEGSVMKVSGTKHLSHRGPARVYDGERATFEAVTRGEINPGDVVVIRYEGPKGGPGMQEMLAVTGAIIGAGPRRRRPAPDRRALLRRHARPDDRPRRARGRGRRRHRAGAGRRHHPPRRGEPRPERGDLRRGNGSATRRVAAAPHPLREGRHGKVRQARRHSVSGSGY